MTVEDVVLSGRLLRLPNYYHDKFRALDYCQVMDTKDGELLVKFDRLRDAINYHSLLEDAQYADYAGIFVHIGPSTLQYNPRLVNFGVVRVDEPSKAPIHGQVRYRSQIFVSDQSRTQFLEFEDIDDAVYTVATSPQTMSLEVPSQFERESLFSLANSNAAALVQPQNSSGSRYYKIELNRVEQGLDQRTTCMIRNIPNKYTQTMLIEWLNETHKGKYDFLYLRMDFRNRCNVGYAFINFIDYRYVLLI